MAMSNYSSAGLKPHTSVDHSRDDLTASIFIVTYTAGNDTILGELDALIEAEQDPSEILIRHITGDWGNLDDEDKRENELSVKEGFRILSAYKLETGQKVWVITEWDRSVTTILLPEEY